MGCNVGISWKSKPPKGDSTPLLGDSTPLIGDSKPLKGEVGLCGVGRTGDASSTKRTVLLFFLLFDFNEKFRFLGRTGDASSTERTVLKFFFRDGNEESRFLAFDLVSLPEFKGGGIINCRHCYVENIFLETFLVFLICNFPKALRKSVFKYSKACFS